MTDFGAHEAFAGAAAKLKEHYGIVVPVSAVRGITEEQGATVLAQEKQKRRLAGSSGRARADCGNGRKHAAGGGSGRAEARRKRESPNRLFMRQSQAGFLPAHLASLSAILPPFSSTSRKFNTSLARAPGSTVL
jgi:hypothetical protein